MENLVFEGINFIIRLKVGLKFIDQEGELVALTISRRNTGNQQGVLYGQSVCQSDGGWKEGFSQPMWITLALVPSASVTNLKAEGGGIGDLFADAWLPKRVSEI